MEFFSSNLIAVMLYIQTAYAIWVFVRSAKFFKLPYVMLSSFWHDGPLASLPFKRKVAVMVHDGPTIEKCEKYNGLFSPVKCGGRTVLTYSENGKTKKLIADDTELEYLRYLNSMMTDTVFTKHRDLLIPGYTLLRAISKSEVFQLFLEGYRPEKYDDRCFIDQSNGKELNSDFMKMISVVPIYLQARNENSASIVAFLLITVFDIFSYYPNLLWQQFKKNLYYFTKLAIANRRLDTRKFLHVFLSSISEGFMYSDYSAHKAYHTEAIEVYVVEPCLLPSYVEGVVALDEDLTDIANRDGKVHVFEFAVNLNKHVIKYKYEGDINSTYLYEHRLNNDTVIGARWQQTTKDNFEDSLRFLKDIERMGIYPALFLTEDGLTLITPKSIEEQLYDFRGLKVVLRKGVFVC